MRRSRVAVVVGSTRGIGFETAKRFVATSTPPTQSNNQSVDQSINQSTYQGWTVVLTGRKTEDVEESVDRLTDWLVSNVYAYKQAVNQTNTSVASSANQSDNQSSDSTSQSHDQSVSLSVDSSLDRAAKRALFPNIRDYQLDITDNQSINRFIESIVLEFGVIDCLIVNAGTLTGDEQSLHQSNTYPTDQSIQQAINVFEVNVFGVDRLIQAALPYMRSVQQSTNLFDKQHITQSVNHSAIQSVEQSQIIVVGSEMGCWAQLKCEPRVQRLLNNQPIDQSISQLLEQTKSRRSQQPTSPSSCQPVNRSVTLDDWRALCEDYLTFARLPAEQQKQSTHHHQSIIQPPTRPINPNQLNKKPKRPTKNKGTRHPYFNSSANQSASRSDKQISDPSNQQSDETSTHSISQIAQSSDNPPVHSSSDKSTGQNIIQSDPLTVPNDPSTDQAPIQPTNHSNSQTVDSVTHPVFKWPLPTQTLGAYGVSKCLIALYVRILANQSLEQLVGSAINQSITLFSQSMATNVHPLNCVIACPGWCATALSGNRGNRSAAEGGQSVFSLVLRPRTSGGLYQDGRAMTAQCMKPAQWLRLSH